MNTREHLKQSEETALTRTQLTDKLHEYLQTLDDSQDVEYYCTRQEIYRDTLQDFLQWLFKEDDAKEERRRQWLALCEEFGNPESKS